MTSNLIDWLKITIKLVRDEINRRYAPTDLSYKKLQKEILCNSQLSSLTFLLKSTATGTNLSTSNESISDFKFAKSNFVANFDVSTPITFF